MSKIKIYNVKKDSIAEEIGLKKGDYILSINDEELIDILDYKFHEADDFVEIEIEHEDETVEIYEIEKDYDDEIGIEFESELIDKPRSCRNKCIFCFMEQLPSNARDTLIFKDDDYRLSFFSGNYITMTNMDESDIERIIKYRVSPINISIHATDEATRCKMLNNRFAGKVLKYLDMLCDAGISINTQIVLCKGINDGKILKKTIQDLSKYNEVMRSICIVPVGISKYRDGLYPLLPLEKEDCINAIEIVEVFQKEFKQKYGTSMVFLADEIYIKAEKQIPEYKEYEEFFAIEDGIGMLAFFEHEFNKEIQKLQKNIKNQKLETKILLEENKTKNICIVTGKITKKYLEKKAKLIEELLPNVNIEVIDITNNYFGENITVTGLVCGQDILNTLKNNEIETVKKDNENKENANNEENKFDYIVIPDVMLKDDEAIFLDDMKLEKLQEELDMKIVITNTYVKCFFTSILMNIPNDNITKINDKYKTIKSYENSIK